MYFQMSPKENELIAGRRLREGQDNGRAGGGFAERVSRDGDDLLRGDRGLQKSGGVGRGVVLPHERAVRIELDERNRSRASAGGGGERDAGGQREGGVSSDGEVSETWSAGAATMWIETGADVTELPAKTATMLT